MKKIIWILTGIFIFSHLWAYSLQDLKSSVVENNPEILKLNQEYEQAKLDFKDAKAGRGPTVDLQVSGTYMLKPLVEPIYLNVAEIIKAIDWPGAQAANVNQHIKIYDGMENTIYTFQLSVMQPLFTWGKLENAVKLYGQIVEIKQTQIESMLQQKEVEVETRFVSLCYLKKILEILEEEKGFAQRMVETSENAEKSGMLLHQDVVEARIQAKELEIAQEDVTEQINNQLLELERTCGIENLTLEMLELNFDESKILEILSWDRADTEERALSGDQLSIKMLTQLKEVNEVAEKIAKGYVNWKPDLALQASAGYGGSRLPFAEPNWRRKDDYTATISVGVKTTIWDGGRKLNDVSRKVSESKIADINKLDARSTIKQTLSSLWNTAEVCSMKIEYQDLKLEAVESKISQQETIFMSGYGSETDVLSSKIDRCNQQIEKIKQELSRAVACLTIGHLAQSK